MCSDGAYMFKMLHKISGGDLGAKNICVYVRTGVGKGQGEGEKKSSNRLYLAVGVPDDGSYPFAPTLAKEVQAAISAAL